MNSKARKFFLKPFASMQKRFHMLVNDGYSVGRAYGARFLFDWRHSLDKKVALELYEYDQISYLNKMLDKIKPDMFVDIGSHAALYSIIAKTRHPNLEVHAFEPDRTNLCQLYANLFVNKLTSSINVHEHGISNQTGTVAFDNSEESSSRGTRRISSAGNSQIQVKRLDDVLQENGKTVAFKIDVEGHECQAIEGASRFLASNKCFLQVESSPENVDALKQLLNTLGYRWITTLSDHYFTNIEAIC